MLIKMVVHKNCSRVTKRYPHQMLCLEYTLNHNQKNKKLYTHVPEIHVHFELAQTIDEINQVHVFIIFHDVNLNSLKKYHFISLYLAL